MSNNSILQLENLALESIEEIILKKRPAHQSLRGMKALSMRLRVASEVCILTRNNQHSTLRDIFYADVPLFISQTNSNRAISDLTQKLKIPRHILNIVNTPKGLWAGHIQIHTPSGETIDGCSQIDRRGLQIPPFIFDNGYSVSMLPTYSQLNFILVVEKDTIFFRLMELEFHQKHAPCLIICGKGMPDFPTRKLLVMTHNISPESPVLILTDHDPSGVLIGLCYTIDGELESLASKTRSVETQSDKMKKPNGGHLTGKTPWFTGESLCCPAAYPLWEKDSRKYFSAPFGILKEEIFPLNTSDRIKIANIKQRLQRIEDQLKISNHSFYFRSRSEWEGFAQQIASVPQCSGDIMEEVGGTFELDAFKDLGLSVEVLIRRAVERIKNNIWSSAKESGKKDNESIALTVKSDILNHQYNVLFDKDEEEGLMMAGVLEEAMDEVIDWT